jgi:hypothetical protein
MVKPVSSHLYRRRALRTMKLTSRSSGKLSPWEMVAAARYVDLLHSIDAKGQADSADVVIDSLYKRWVAILETMVAAAGSRALRSSSIQHGRHKTDRQAISQQHTSRQYSKTMSS